MTSQQLKDVFQEFSKTGNEPMNADVAALKKRLRVVGRNIQGSDFHRRALQHEIKALMLGLGLPTFFITINPADLHNPLFLHYAGHKINLDNPFEANWLKKSQRADLVAADPVAAAKFFHKIVCVWLEHLLGVRSTGRHDRGILGRLSGYYGTVETQLRGSLHLHLLAWFVGSKSPQEVGQLLAANCKFGEDLLEYLGAIIQEQFPCGELPDEEAKVHAVEDEFIESVCCARPVLPDVDSFDVTNMEELAGADD